jgi:hypothetical protein
MWDSRPLACIKEMHPMKFKPSAIFMAVLAALLCTSAHAQQPAQDLPKKIGFHEAVYDTDGKLLPWTPWEDAIGLEMEWYLKCPVNDRGYPNFVVMTFMDDKYQVSRLDSIPATQNGTAIMSYLKWWEFKGKSDPRILDWAWRMGDYLVRETLTPNKGAWPRFTRSTGYYMDFPLFRSSQGDSRYGRNVIEPDKGGIAGYALLKLYDATGDKRFLKQAMRNADALAKNMRPADATRSPWPFRVDSIVGGEGRGQRSGNMVYILRLFDALIEKGHRRYVIPRNALWKWIKECQFQTPDDPDKCLWVHFFEDYDMDSNRNSWAPLEMARYLIERKEALDPDWKADAEKLIQFSIRHFSGNQPGGVLTMGEQDDDKKPWGGACSKIGGVAALFYAAGGGEKYKDMAFRNLNWMTYFIDSDGAPAQRAEASNDTRGGWQEDCHTDVVHNFADAMAAVPEWAGKMGH